jgi:uncharacterized protein
MSMSRPPVALVVAKAPVPGEVKTRLAAGVGAEQAADLAAASLLDTLDACESVFASCHIALAGSLSQACSGALIQRRLRTWTVHSQRGGSLGARLAHAHAHVSRAAAAPVVQVGMDTPQLTADSLADVSAAVTSAEYDAVLGPAADGGWWVLALRDPHHAVGLCWVSMSTATTYDDTRDLLVAAGAHVTAARVLADVDTVADAAAVAALAPGTRFAATWGSLK